MSRCVVKAIQTQTKAKLSFQEEDGETRLSIMGLPSAVYLAHFLAMKQVRVYSTI